MTQHKQAEKHLSCEQSHLEITWQQQAETITKQPEAERESRKGMGLDEGGVEEKTRGEQIYVENEDGDVDIRRTWKRETF